MFGPKKITPESNWKRRQTEMPGLQETFNLIRQICAGNSSFLGTCVTSLEMIRNDTRAIRQDYDELLRQNSYDTLSATAVMKEELGGFKSLFEALQRDNEILFRGSQQTAVWLREISEQLTQQNALVTTLLGASDDDTSPSRVPSDRSIVVGDAAVDSER